MALNKPSQIRNDIEAEKQKRDSFYDARINDVSRDDMVSSDKDSARYNYDTYKYDHFSGAQAKIFFGDIWVDELITINYVYNQSKQPIYGYASQKFDDVAMGTQIGSGSLSIAFKETGYLNIIHQLIKSQKGKAKNAAKNATSRIIGGKEDKIANGDRDIKKGGIEFSAKVNTNATPSLIRNQENVEEAIKSLQGVENTPFGVDQDFEDIAELYEDAIWGDSNGKLLNGKIKKFLTADEFDYTYGKYGPNGIDVSRDGLYSDALNIMLTFGDINDYRAEHTIVVLNDVHFTGQGMVVSPTGEPIAETYEFFFRDLNETLTDNSFNINSAKWDVGSDDNLSRIEEIDELLDNINDEILSMGVELLSYYDGQSWNQLKDILININSSLEGVGISGVDESSIIDGRLTIDSSEQLYGYVSDSIASNNNKLSEDIKHTLRSADKVMCKVSLYGKKGRIKTYDNVHQVFNKEDKKLHSEVQLILTQVVPDSLIFKVNPKANAFLSNNIIKRSDFYANTPNDIEGVDDYISKTTTPEYEEIGNEKFNTTLPDIDKSINGDDIEDNKLKEANNAKKQIEEGYSVTNGFAAGDNMSTYNLQAANNALQIDEIKEKYLSNITHDKAQKYLDKDVTVKSNGDVPADLQGIQRTTIIQFNKAVNDLPKDLQKKLVITSGTDSYKHSINSKHYKGLALDLRSKDLNDNQLEKIETVFKKYGFNEYLDKRTDPDNHGDHIHIGLGDEQYLDFLDSETANKTADFLSNDKDRPWWKGHKHIEGGASFDGGSGAFGGGISGGGGASSPTKTQLRIWKQYYGNTTFNWVDFNKL